MVEKGSAGTHQKPAGCIITRGKHGGVKELAGQQDATRRRQYQRGDMGAFVGAAWLGAAWDGLRLAVLAWGLASGPQGACRRGWGGAREGECRQTEAGQVLQKLLKKGGQETLMLVQGQGNARARLSMAGRQITVYESSEDTRWRCQTMDGIGCGQSAKAADECDLRRARHSTSIRAGGETGERARHPAWPHQCYHGGSYGHCWHNGLCKAKAPDGGGRGAGSSLPALQRCLLGAGWGWERRARCGRWGMRAERAENHRWAGEHEKGAGRQQGAGRRVPGAHA